MQRLRTEVLAVEGAGERLWLRAKVVGAAQAGYRLPEGVKDKEVTIERRALFGWQIAAGDSLLLNPAESATILCPNGAVTPGPEPAADTTVAWEADSDRDGFVERHLANAYLALAVTPAHGGRIASLTHRRRGLELLARPLLPEREHPRFGGLVDRLTGSDPERLDQAEYTVAETGDGFVAVSCELKAPVKGDLCRVVRLAPARPWVEVDVSIRRRHDDKPGEKDKDKKKDDDDRPKREPEVAYEPDLRIDIGGGGPSNATEYLVPTPDGLRRQRWDRFQFVPEHRPTPAGWAAVRDHRHGLALVLLFRPEQTDRLGAGEWEQIDLCNLALRLAGSRLAPGGLQTRGLGILVADALAMSEAALVTATVGPSQGKRVPVYLTARGDGDRARAVVSCGGRTRRLTLTPVDTRACGRLFTGELLLSGGATGEAEVRLGTERLSLSWQV